MIKKENVLISACLIGKNCRYDGKNNYIKEIEQLKLKYNLVSVCPEVLAGMTTPRNPAEQKNNKVIDNEGNDLTELFSRGAKKCLEIAKKYNCKKAILKARSPSCGTKQIYDGSFSKRLTDGHGVTAGLLLDNGIEVYSESEIDCLLKPKPKLLLQACCGPCATTALSELTCDYAITIYFWGSNIHPSAEYDKRLVALQMVNKALNADREIIIAPYSESEFDSATQGLEHEPEGKARCAHCIELRLRAAAEYAATHGFTYFASSLSTSPHKNSELINQIGKQLGDKHDITYLATDFKKDDGFRESIRLSKELNIYRQNYCGCRFSVRG